MEWSNIDVKTFKEIQDYLSTTQDGNIEQSVHLLSLIEGKDEDTYFNMPINKLTEEFGKLKFMESTPQAAQVKNSYKINGTEYVLTTNLQEMTVAQYIDYQVYIKNPQQYMQEMLTVFLIPKGKKYNEDYDVAEAAKDMGNLPIEDAYGISFFLTVLLHSLTKVTTSSALRKMLKELKKVKDETKRRAIIAGMQAIINGCA